MRVESLFTSRVLHSNHQFFFIICLALLIFPAIIFAVELRWAEIASNNTVVPKKRSHHTSIFNEDGKMIAFGGYDGNAYNNDVWVLNLKNYIWKEIITTGKKPSARNKANLNVFSCILDIPYIVVVILIVILLLFPDTVRTTSYNLCDVYTLFFLYSVYIFCWNGQKMCPS